MASLESVRRAAVVGVVGFLLLTQVLERAHAGAARRKNSWWTKRSLLPASPPSPPLDYTPPETKNMGESSYICFLNQNLAVSKADRNGGAADLKLYGVDPPCFTLYPSDTPTRSLPPWNPRPPYAHARALV